MNLVINTNQQQNELLDYLFDTLSITELEKLQANYCSSSSFEELNYTFINAYILYKKGAISESIKLFIPLIALAKKQNRLVIVYYSEYCLAVIMGRLGTKNEAIASLSKIKNDKNNDNPLLKAKVHNYLALTYHSLNEYEKMIHEFKQALNHITDEKVLSHNPTLSNYALSLSYTNDFEQAEIYFNKAQSLYKKYNSEIGYYYYLCTYSPHLENIGQIDAAESNYQTLIIESKKSYNSYQFLVDIIEYANFAIRHNRIDGLLPYLSLANPFISGCELPPQIASLA